MRVAVTAVLLISAVLIGCGGGNSEPELEPAVRAYSDNFLAGNADEVHARMTARCRERTNLDQLRPLVAMAKENYGTATMTSFEIAQQSEGLARVTYRYDQSSIDQVEEPWALEDGQWRNDDC